ncbi:MAG: short-chain fatty acyl-CoA regulator family protein [Boseongicola sp.]|nr:short-chain fatty acyl-CoA regulator family protein [Boseongicola sp.]
MNKTFIGPQLRQLRRAHKQTQAAMAKTLGVSPAYVNLLENNQRSLSVQMLMALSEKYAIDWRELVQDPGSNVLAELRSVLQDPIFRDTPDLQELRAAVDHAPGLVEKFLQIYRTHRTTLDKVLRQGRERMPENLVSSSPETIIHDFFRNHGNHFPELETTAERIRAERPCAPDDVYAMLKDRLKARHGVKVRIQTVEDMSEALRIFDRDQATVFLSQALDYPNRTFQLAHVLCLLEADQILDGLVSDSGITSSTGLARCQVELANYFASAFLMPYADVLATARATKYDVDRVAAAFSVSFEQVCHRLTTLQRRNAKGVPFFFLRIDKAGNVTKRFNSTTFTLAEFGGACPVWNIHTSFRTPGVILPQFVELPEGERFFTISRTSDRPVFSRESQDRRLALALGCEFRFVDEIGYAQSFNLDREDLFSQIGINCHLCPRQACSQRAHQPLLVELPISPDRRGNTRYES